MLRLALLRHAEAEARAAGGDMERPLTKNGRDLACALGRYCKTLPLLPDLVLVSSAQRARETYDLFADSLGEKLNVLIEPELYNATSTAIKQRLAALSSEQGTVLIIGHNPGIAEAAIALAGDGDPAMLAELRRHYPAPALALIDFKVETWAEIAAGKGWLAGFII